MWKLGLSNSLYGTRVLALSLESRMSWCQHQQRFDCLLSPAHLFDVPLPEPPAGVEEPWTFISPSALSENRTRPSGYAWNEVTRSFPDNNSAAEETTTDSAPKPPPKSKAGKKTKAKPTAAEKTEEKEKGTRRKALL